MRRSITWLTAASALALVCAAAPAMAQDATITVGQTVEGELTRSDPTVEIDDDKYARDEFRINATVGQRLEANLSSDDFDAYLELYESDGETLIAEDDDGGSGTSARIRYTAETDGQVILRVRSLGGDLGDYELELKEREAAPAIRQTGSISVGQSVEGELGEGDAEGDEGGRFDAWMLSAQAGDRIALTLRSEDFDALLLVGRMKSGEFEELARNDDGGDTNENDDLILDSYLVFTAPDTGDYQIRATSFADDGEGAYVLTAEQGPPPPETMSLAFDTEVQGVLDTDDGVDGSGNRHDAYRFRVAAGQRIAIEMRSSDFDTYLELGRDDGATFEMIAEDDDGMGDDTDSRLVWTAEKGGDYVVHARSFSSEDEGDYTLLLKEIPPDPEPVPVSTGATLQGEITDKDAQDSDGGHFDAYRISGVEDQRIQVVMRSGDFDTMLSIGEAEGDFEALASDDDGLGEGTDSRLNFTFPETGDYIIRAAPLGSSEDGLYEMVVTDRGREPALGSILIGSTARGTLTDLDAETDEGANYDGYRISLADGEKLRIVMISNDFDAYLSIGKEEEDGGYKQIAFDDDSFSDTHAQIEPTIDDAGTYVIRASSFGAKASGDYVLIVERKP